ncbi:hypothetical protein ABK040_005654 [Willaertia magna]
MYKLQPMLKRNISPNKNKYLNKINLKFLFKKQNVNHLIANNNNNNLSFHTILPQKYQRENTLQQQMNITNSNDNNENNNKKNEEKEKLKWSTKLILFYLQTLKYSMVAILFIIFSVFPGIYLHSTKRELVRECHTQEDYEKIAWKIKLYEYGTNTISAIDIALMTVLSITFFFVIPFTFLYILEASRDKDSVIDSVEENNLNISSSGNDIGCSDEIDERLRKFKENAASKRKR